MDSGTESPVDRQQTRADQVVTMARRHAAEIRAAAEQEAERVLRGAEEEAERRLKLRFETEQRERAQFAIQRRQIESCLDTTASTLAQIRELIAVLPDAAPGTEPTSAPVAESTHDKPGRGHRLVNGLVVILGLWTAGMIITLVVLSQRSTTIEESNVRPDEIVASPATPPRAEAVQASQSIPKAPPAATHADAVALSEDTELTVTFVAASDCWISINSDDGASDDRLLKASERYVVHARDAVTFKAGNAAAVSLLINGQPTGPLGAEGRVVTRRIDRANYRSFLKS